MIPQQRQERKAALGLGVVGMIVVLFYAWSGNRAPLGCPLFSWVGVPCPLCGMTRSFRAMLCGDWLGALYFHAFGPWLLGFLLLCLVQVGWELATDQTRPFGPLSLLRWGALQRWLLFWFLLYYAVRLSLAPVGVFTPLR